METWLFKSPVLVKIQHNKLNLWDVELSETSFLCRLSRCKQSCATLSVFRKELDRGLVFFFF